MFEKVCLSGVLAVGCWHKRIIDYGSGGACLFGTAYRRGIVKRPGKYAAFVKLGLAQSRKLEYVIDHELGAANAVKHTAGEEIPYRGNAVPALGKCEAFPHSQVLAFIESISPFIVRSGSSADNLLGSARH